MNRAATIALTPLSWLYGAVMKARASLYGRGWLPSFAVEVPIISVGNLTTGGTGKTPLVAWVSRRLAEKGLRVCILTRGYGRAEDGQRLLVSDGKQIFADAAQAGDEALMLAQALKGHAAVVCDADRVAAAHWAIGRLESNVFVLDDAFQNLRIRRDLNIVTIDATQPWSAQKVLPAGNLREPVGALERADCIVLTRFDQAQQPDLVSKVERAGGSHVFTSRIKTTAIRALNREANPSPAKAVAAFCAVGNPEAFFEHLKRENFELRHTTAYRDHHDYSQSDIDKICRTAIAAGAQSLLTTAKDAVKLKSTRFDLPCYVVEIEIEIRNDEKLLELIDRAILRKQNGQ
jgi:tetraacyldisaccharide 4'-kinase